MNFLGGVQEFPPPKKQKSPSKSQVSSPSWKDEKPHVDLGVGGKAEPQILSPISEVGTLKVYPWVGSFQKKKQVGSYRFIYIYIYLSIYWHKVITLPETNIFCIWKYISQQKKGHKERDHLNRKNGFPGAKKQMLVSGSSLATKGLKFFEAWSLLLRHGETWHLQAACHRPCFFLFVNWGPRPC